MTTTTLITDARTNRGTPQPVRLYFDGNDTVGYLVPTDTTILQVGAVTDYTCGATVNLRKKNTTVQNDNHCIFSTDFSFGTNTGGAFYVHATDGSLRAFFGNTAYASSAGVFTYGIEQQVTFTLTGTTLTGYINGTSVWTQTVTRVATAGGTGRYICMEGISGEYNFRGLYGTIHDIFIVKSLLTPAQITAIVAGTYPSGLGIHYKCDEGAGPCLKDSSGNDNTGFVTFNSIISSKLLGAKWRK